MTEAATREFDQWMRSPPTPRDPSQSDVDRILDAYMAHVEANCHDPSWCAEQDAMYWEGRQGEPYNEETFDEETRDLDQRAYQDWCLTPHLKSSIVEG